MKVKAEENAAIIEDGTYEVECIGVEEAYMEDSLYDPNVLKWHFEVLGSEMSDGKPLVLDPLSGQKLTPLSKFWEWATALGHNPNLGEELDTDTLIGKHAMARIETKVKDGKKGFPKIISLVSMPRKPAQKAPTRAQEARQPIDFGSEEVSAWWKQVRDAGIERKAALDESTGRYGLPPADLTSDQRAELYAALVTA